MMASIDNVIKEFMGKGQVHGKINKYDWPYVLWVEPVVHQNLSTSNLRAKFLRGLYTAAQMHQRMLILPFRSGWNNEAPALVNNNCLTHIGLHAYWAAVDSTIKFADTKVMRNFGLKFCQVFQKDKLQTDAEARMVKFEMKINRMNEFRVQIQSRQVREFFERRGPRMATQQNRSQYRPHQPIRNNQPTIGRPSLPRREQNREQNHDDQPDSTSNDVMEERNQTQRRHGPFLCRKQLFKK